MKTLLSENISLLNCPQGDSGAGLVVRQNGSAPVLVGVVSYGDGSECGHENAAGIYTRVQTFTPWIRKAIGSR